MIEAIICLNNLTCHFDNLFQRNYQSSETAEVCIFLKKQNIELPDSCTITHTIIPPKRRNEF